MSKCLPSSALSAKRKKYHWQVLDYEAEGVKGVMLSAGPETEAPDITYPLNLQGWYAIHVGIWGRRLAEGDVGMVKIRLKDDPCFTIFRREKPSPFTLEEGFWKSADLSNQDLVIGQQREGFKKGAFLAYVRLEHLSEEQVEEIQRDRARKDTKRLIAANDAHGLHWTNRITAKEGIWEQIEPYRNTDFKKLYWETGWGHTCYYGTQVGSLFSAGLEDFPRIGDRYIAESLQILTAKGINPIGTALEYAHSIGLEFHVSQRIEAFCCAPPWEEAFSTEFYKEHPEMRLIDRDGTEIAGMSYAYPEVRKYMISILREAAGYGADGAAIIYVRGPPYILYEESLIEGFKKKYGIDPRKINEGDERWLRYRASFMTQYMREVRQAMDEVGEKLDKRLEVSTILMATKEQNLFFGLDLEAWIKEGLVDNLVPYPWGDKDVEMKFFTKLTKRGKCKVYPNVMPRQMPPEEFRKKALAYYEAGADGLFFWDTNARHDTTSMWSTVRRLGHVNELRAWAKEEKHKEEPRTMKLLKLGGYTMQKYSPYRGG